MRLRSKKRIKIKAFTLIELMIVMTFLALIALVQVRGKLMEKRLEAAEAFAEELNWTLEAIRRFYVMNGRFPNDLAELQPNFIPAGHPQDPFGGAIRVDVTNDPALPINRQHFDILITNGIATTDYANVILKRVPFATRAGNQIRIPLRAFWIWIDKEIVYSGILPDGGIAPVQNCLGGLNNYPFVAPVAAKSTDGGAITAYRSWVTRAGNNYVVHCKTSGEFDPGEQDNNCYVWLLQICH